MPETPFLERIGTDDQSELADTTPAQKHLFKLLLLESLQDTVIEDLTCRRLEIVDANRRTAVSVFPWAVGGRIDVYNHEGSLSTSISQTFADPLLLGTGLVSVMSKEGLAGVELRGDANGGRILVLNNTDTRDEVVQIHADEHGDGVVGAYNRQGKGRTLKPGP